MLSLLSKLPPQHFLGEYLPLNLFRYITFRSGVAFFLGFFLVIFLMPGFIEKIRHWGTQPIREDGPASHLLSKKGTPTMGGLLILFSFFCVVACCADWQNFWVWIISWITLGYGMLGSLDDWAKIRAKNTAGISAKMKLFFQMAIALVAIGGVHLVQTPHMVQSFFLPFFKDVVLPLTPWLIGLFSILVVTGASNAVNLTDGLDGLAIGPFSIACGFLALFSYLAGHVGFSQYLHVPFIPGAGEIVVLCAGMIGASLGFLWYNAAPAQIMMGDTGSLALGGFLGIVGVIIRQEVMLALVGAVFVLETLSVVIQVLIFKRTKKRVFLMAPLHHHFEQAGWAETKIVTRFWLFSLIMGVVSLILLKVR